MRFARPSPATGFAAAGLFGRTFVSGSRFAALTLTKKVNRVKKRAGRALERAALVTKGTKGWTVDVGSSVTDTAPELPTRPVHVAPTGQQPNVPVTSVRQ